jgi:hypothetical protein
MKTRRRTPTMNKYDHALTCRLPRGVASNFNRLEAMRKDIFLLLTIATTNPYLDDTHWNDNEIQQAADRLKAIWIRRAQALKDARAKGWREKEAA